MLVQYERGESAKCIHKMAPTNQRNCIRMVYVSNFVILINCNSSLYNNTWFHDFTQHVPGFIYDVTLDYDLPFYIMGAIEMAGGLVLFMAAEMKSGYITKICTRNQWY